MKQTPVQMADEGYTSRERNSAEFQESYNQGTSGHIRAHEGTKTRGRAKLFPKSDT